VYADWLYLRRWMGAAHMANYFSRLSSRQATAFLHGMASSDGNFNKSKSNSWDIHTSSAPMRDHLMMMAVLAGASVQCSVNEERESLRRGNVQDKTDDWKVALRFRAQKDKKDHTRVKAVTAVKFYKEQLSAGDRKKHAEHGFVYDITVEDNHNFWVRRLSSTRSLKGKGTIGMGGCFTGNCGNIAAIMELDDHRTANFKIFEAAPQEARGQPPKKPQPDYFL